MSSVTVTVVFESDGHASSQKAGWKTIAARMSFPRRRKTTSASGDGAAGAATSAASTVL